MPEQQNTFVVALAPISLRKYAIVKISPLTKPDFIMSTLLLLLQLCLLVSLAIWGVEEILPFSFAVTEIG